MTISAAPIEALAPRPATAFPWTPRQSATRELAERMSRPSAPGPTPRAGAGLGVETGDGLPVNAPPIELGGRAARAARQGR